MINKASAVLLTVLIVRPMAAVDVSTAPVSGVYTVETRRRDITQGRIRAIHLTGSAAASKRYREKLYQMIDQTMINGVIIDVKEESGAVYIPGVKLAERVGAYEPIMSDWKPWLAELKARGVYTGARIVVFKDNVYARKNPDAAVKSLYGGVWFDRTKNTWLDPYSDEAHTYNLLIAVEAAQLGFDEIQFDYIRFPTDGNLSHMRFSDPRGRRASAEALVRFLTKARHLLHPLGVKISIDVFGLTTAVVSGMGIGQQLKPMAEQVDYVCPMIYPSHYNPGEYGMKNPNDDPYRTISLSMRDAKRLLGDSSVSRLRPYLQDFSLRGRGIRYGPEQVRAQIQACADRGIHAWTLWNARCNYTWEALRQEPVASEPPFDETPVRSTSSVENPQN